MEAMFKILVLDDEESIRQSIAAYFEDEGFEVYQAGSGEEGMVLIQEHEMDAAIIDIRLPGMDGNAFMIQANEVWPNMRFVVHTGSADYILPDSAKNIGVGSEDIFIKPVKDLRLLVEALKQYLK